MAYTRIAAVAAALLTSATVLASGTAVAATENSPWWQTDHDAARSRYNPTESVLTVAAMPQVGYLRSVVAPPSTGTGPCASSQISDPVLAGNELFAAVNGALVAYDAATGRVLWRTPVDTDGDSVDSAPILGNSRVYLSSFDCTSASDPNGGVFAFDQSTGRQLWAYGIDAKPQRMVSYQGRLFVTWSLSEAGGSTGRVTALDSRTGTVVWSRTSDVCAQQDDAMIVHRYLMYRGCASDGTSDPRLVAATLDAGTTAWSRAGNWHVLRGDGPSTNGHHLLVRTPAGKIADLWPGTGSTHWTTGTLTNVGAVGGSRVYGACSTYVASDSVCAVRWTNGSLVWTALSGRIPSAVQAVAADVAYTTAGALDAATGSWAWALCVMPDPCQVVAVGDGRIAVRSGPRMIDLYGLTGY